MNKLFFVIVLVFISCGTTSHKENLMVNLAPKYQELLNALQQQNADQIVKIVHKKKLDLNYSNGNGLSLLNWCIINEKPTSVKKLLELGANPNLQDSLCKFPLPIIEAAQKSETSVFLQAAIKHGGNINGRCKNLSGNLNGYKNLTPLLAAISSSYIDNVKLLIDHGADVNMISDSLPAPLAVAIMFREMTIAQYLIQKGAKLKDTNMRDIEGNKVSFLSLLSNVKVDSGTNRYRIKLEILKRLSSEASIK